MNWQLLIKELDSLNLPTQQYAITSSGCMAVRGLREAGDIDLVLSDELWNQLAPNHEIIDTPIGKKIKLSENVEGLGQFKSPPTSTDMLQNTDHIDGHQYVNLLLVRDLKNQMGRDKDKVDILMIDAYLANTPK